MLDPFGQDFPEQHPNETFSLRMYHKQRVNALLLEA